MADVVIRIPRVLPLLLAAGVVYGGCASGLPVVKQTADTFYVATTRWEAGELAAHLKTDAAAGIALPDVDDPNGLRKYIRSNAYASMGRDPARDFWARPYVLERTSEPGELLVVSFGANGSRDECVSTLGRSAAPEEPGGAPPAGGAPDPNGPDDVCAVVRIER